MCCLPAVLACMQALGAREAPTWYVPAAHSVQLAAPSVAAYEPGRHAAHALGAALPGIGLAEPAAQSTQSAADELPFVGLYVPASHSW